MRLLWHLVGMRIACPSCSAAYDVADSLLPPGRIVQCARCNKAWTAVPVEAPPVNEPEPREFTAEPAAEWQPETEAEKPRLTAVDRLAHRSPPPRSPGGTAVRAAWAASIAAVLGLLWVAYTWRADVMTQWPQSVRVYSLFGLAPPQH
jgi:predicted Zn finger-like uncharacterized protein